MELLKMKKLMVLGALAAVSGCCTFCEPETPPNTLSEKEKAEGWQLLWDGKTGNGWIGLKSLKDTNRKGAPVFPEKGWSMSRGVLTVLPRKGISNGKWVDLPPEDAKLGGGGDIVTIKKYKDFEFTFDFKLTDAANSGVKYFFDENKNKGTCEEYQILDKNHPDWKKGFEGNRRVASLYDLIPSNADKYLNDMDEWNTGKIVSKGNKVEHWLNGEKVVEYVRGSKAFRDAVAESKYAKNGTDGQPWGELAEGRILLQDHSDSMVSFRNLKIREL
jgi:hypothetical protein